MKAIGVGPGDTVLIHGAAGSLGAFAVQLAKEWGAKTNHWHSQREQPRLRTFARGYPDYVRGATTMRASPVACPQKTQVNRPR